MPVSAKELYDIFCDIDSAIVDEMGYIETDARDLSRIGIDGPVNFEKLAAWLNERTQKEPK